MSDRAPTGGRELDDVRTLTRVSFWGCRGGSRAVPGEHWCRASRLRHGMEGALQPTPPLPVSNSSHQVGLLNHLRRPATRSSRSPEDGGPRDVSRETGPRVWTHRLSSRTKSSGPVDPACRVTGVRRVRLPTAATGGGWRGRSTTAHAGYAECLGPTRGRAEVHTTMAWCR